MNQTSESNGRTGWPIVLIAASLLLVLGRDLLDNNRQQAALKLTVARQEEGVAKSRDVAKGLRINVPANYFPCDDPRLPPLMTWRSHAHLLYANWLNYYVYQATPFDLEKLPATSRGAASRPSGD